MGLPDDGLPGPGAFERAGLLAWPGIEVDWDGAWIRRAAGGYTQRANSVQSLDPADDAHVTTRIGASVDWFAARGLPPIFRITPLASPAIDQALDAQGWQSLDASQLFATAIEPGPADPRGALYDLLDPRFLAAQQQLAGLSAARLEGMKALLGVIAVPARGIVLHGDDGAPLASALMAVAEDIVITGNVVTDARHRRQGHGAAMMRTGHAWAHQAGARIAALNVAADNAAGQALYRSLGYAYQYDYHYRVPGTP
tara:strand:- start:7752 stop:8516 length:765 start_codon:yes stop_codon:yes gene_type:complete